MNRNRQIQRRQTHERPENTDTIREMELESIMLSKERNEFAEEARDIETSMVLTVEAEWETFKSKSLSNQIKRKVVVDGRLEMDDVYRAYVSDINAADEMLKELTINISFEKRQFTRSMAHLSDIYEMREALNLLARDVHGIASAYMGGFARRGLTITK